MKICLLHNRKEKRWPRPPTGGVTLTFGAVLADAVHSVAPWRRTLLPPLLPPILILLSLQTGKTYFGFTLDASRVVSRRSAHRRGSKARLVRCVTLTSAPV